MRAKKINIMFLMSVVCSTYVQSQTISNPNYALKSPETLNVLRVETKAENTVIYLSVENRREGGNFCADKNIFIVYPDGTRSKLISAKGIPVCPAMHNFKTIGEKLNFELVFPAIRKGIKGVNLVESCSDNCFSFYGLCIDDNLNSKLDEAFVLAENGKQIEALSGFRKIADAVDFQGSGLEGLVYMNIVELAKKTGKSIDASNFYNKLKAKSVPDSEFYIRHLNSEGIRY